MKKTILILMALLALSSCRDENEEAKQESIVGIWKLQKSEVISGKDNKSIIRVNTPDACEKKSTYEFTAYNKLVSREFELQNTVCKDLGTDSTTYTFDNANKKIIIDGDQSNVDEFTKSSLIISNSLDDYNGDGINDTSRTYLFK